MYNMIVNLYSRSKLLQYVLAAYFQWNIAEYVSEFDIMIKAVLLWIPIYKAVHYFSFHNRQLCNCIHLKLKDNVYKIFRIELW